MDAARYADRLIETAIERGEFSSGEGAGEPIGRLDDDPLWWVKSFLERESLPGRRHEAAAEIDHLVARAIQEPSLDTARQILEAANAAVRAWNEDHRSRDHLEERSEVWLVSERARRPA